MKTNEIRKLYMEYFKSKGHTVVASDSLIPSNDPTLLFSSAGMVQFKPLYVTKGPIPYNTATSCQKCFRTPDLERVGLTPRHHTFFEMLGNFSFGDYFKKEAIEYAWDFSVNVLKLPKELLWVTIFENDDEAGEIWHKHIGLPKERIVKLGKKDNFWGPVGGTGPCGPCSEIYIDFGEEFGCGKPDCKPGCDCDRFEEFWNNVFPSFDARPDGKMLPLARRGVDTGMGLERLASILQNTKNNYDIDIIKLIVLEAAKLTGSEYKKDAKKDVWLKIITDHVRASTFLISDGIHPLNEGRGYVLRRIIRRAVRYGKLLGEDNSFLYKLSGTVVDIMKEAYPELGERRVQISDVIKQEEDRFRETLNQGINLLEEVMAKCKGVIPGAEVFKLHDTYGFPLELTKEIAAERNLKVDEKGFEAALAEQQERARGAWKGSGEKELPGMLSEFPKTVFTGYSGEERYSGKANILGIIAASAAIKSAKKDDEVLIVLDRTPFYGESGGQMGDVGRILGDKFEAEVINTEKFQQKVFVHRVKILRGVASPGDAVLASVDIKRRKAIMRNHTATHLLQAALRAVLGDHVRQSGSFVGPDYFRFDFTHFKSVTKDELDKIENAVNERILDSLNVTMDEMDASEAKKTGALAFFGEKYGDKVRVVCIEGVSKEFCGGTHVNNIGKIGVVKIVSESSVASGIRRIEAVSGVGAFKLIKDKERIVTELANNLKIDPAKLIERVGKMSEEIKTLEKEIVRLKRGEGAVKTTDLAGSAKEIKGMKAVIAKLEGVEAKDMRDIGDKLRDKLQSGVIVLFASNEEKTSYLCMVTKDLTDKVNAGNIIKEIAKLTGGSGGGRPDMAQGGCKKVEDLDALVKKAEQII